jgi:adenosylmethionine-8-amino-7-oxononanoate aminotransferase
MKDLNQAWVQRDLNVLWHPCTQMKEHEKIPLIPVQSAQGVFLKDFNGKEYLDTVSSWWVNILGHCNPKINEKIKAQLDTLEHVILAGFSHEPAVKLAEKLVEITPKGLSRVFYADNGSSAVEVALKMSYHAWHNQGQKQKRLFFTLDNSYHGETIGAMSVSQVGLYKNTYQDLLFDVISIPVADTFLQPKTQPYEDYADALLLRIESLMQEHAEESCAVIVEPLIQCAGNMRMHKPYFLRKLFELTRKYNIHFIADEIATGFGRTGTLFACEQAGISPDFMCLSKGITAGYLPLAAVLTHEDIYQSFYDDYASGKAFLHSHSYTGNPLACTAALASIEILQDENIIEKNQEKIANFTKLGHAFKEYELVAQVRQTGMVLAVELYADKVERSDMLAIYQYALQQGVLLRPLGNVIYFMPPYIISAAQIEQIVQVALDGIKNIEAKKYARGENLSVV